MNTTSELIWQISKDINELDNCNNEAYTILNKMYVHIPITKDTEWIRKEVKKAMEILE